MKPFCIMGTPRSRTTWFAKFLQCEHEPSKRWSRSDDIREYFSYGCGAADSTLTLYWQVVLAVPGMRAVVIVRPRQEIIESARQFGFAADYNRLLDALDRAVNAISHVYPRTPIVPFSSLTPKRCAAIYRYLLRRPCPRQWLEHWASVIVEPDVAAAMATVSSNRHGIAALYGGLL